MARTKEFNKEEILDKAVELFSSKGYFGSSMEEVINHIGLSRSSLYDTFGDKRLLYLAALERYREQVGGSLIELINNAKEVLPVIRKIFVMAVNESLADKFFRGCFMVNSTVELAPHDKEVNGLVKENMQDVEDAFFRLVRKGQETGEITSKHNARAIARFLFNTTSGLRVAAKAGVDKKVFDDIVKVTLSVLSE